MAPRCSVVKAILVILACQLGTTVARTKLCQDYTPTVEGGKCTPTKKQCDFKLVVASALTMTTPDGAAVYLASNYTAWRSDNNQVLSEEEQREVIFADGFQPARLVTVANGTMPGPCIAFYKDQVVTVEVVNNMNSEGLTVHWHGLDMRGNSYMDGVAFVSQCPIQPGQSFVYNFTSQHPGTYWYHSHLGAQRSMGILGPLIVRHKEDSNPTYDERTLVLQDWNHDFSSERMELGVYENNEDKWFKRKATETYDGTFFSVFQFHSGLINGRGRFLLDDNPQTYTPLEVIEVEKGRSYRFRVIAAGAIYPYRLAVEGHELSMVASDGHDFAPITVESFVISPGERYDFMLTTDKTAQDYMIFAETLENITHTHRAEAILRYKTGQVGTIRLPSRSCPDNRCTVFNCPFGVWPGESCTLLDTARPVTNENAPKAPQGTAEEIKQIFLNFGFPGPRSDASVNGIRFEKPPLAAILHPNDMPNACPAHCGEAGQLCECAHKVKLEKNKIHQIILVNMGQGQNFSHPIHIHGFSFFIVKMGFPDYHTDTGKVRRPNVDINCPDNPDPDINYCNKARWANDSWNRDPNIIPGLNLDHAIRKDTVILPSGGYVVIRLKADNPGMWFVHCHIEMHHLGGMALMLDATDGQGEPPKGFPTCGNFPSKVAAKATSAASSPVTSTTQLTVLLVIVAFIGQLRC